MSLYLDSTITDPRRQSARQYEYPARRGAYLSTGARVELYEKTPAPSRHYPASDREPRSALVVRSQPIRVRNISPADYERSSPRRTQVIRPRSVSRVRIQEPVFVTSDATSSSSSSDDEVPRRRRRRRRRSHDHTRIRTTSRPGKKTEHALVRTPSKARRKSDPKAVTLITDLELKTDRRHRQFQRRRSDLENIEALTLVRARSRQREGLADDASDLGLYELSRHPTTHLRESRHKHHSLDIDRREIVIPRDDYYDNDRSHSNHNPQRHHHHHHNHGLLIAASPHNTSRRHHRSPSPDRESLDSSIFTTTTATTSNSFGHNHPYIRLPRVYDDDDDHRRHHHEPSSRSPRRDSAHHPSRDRESEREHRALKREKVALEREKLLLERERTRGPAAVPDEEEQVLLPRKGMLDYLKQGSGYLRDGQMVYRSRLGFLK